MSSWLSCTVTFFFHRYELVRNTCEHLPKQMRNFQKVSFTNCNNVGLSFIVDITKTCGEAEHKSLLLSFRNLSLLNIQLFPFESFFLSSDFGVIFYIHLNKWIRNQRNSLSRDHSTGFTLRLLMLIKTQSQPWVSAYYGSRLNLLPPNYRKSSISAKWLWRAKRSLRFLNSIWQEGSLSFLKIDNIIVYLLYLCIFSNIIWHIISLKTVLGLYFFMNFLFSFCRCTLA